MDELQQLRDKLYIAVDRIKQLETELTEKNNEIIDLNAALELAMKTIEQNTDALNKGANRVYATMIFLIIVFVLYIISKFS